MDILLTGAAGSIGTVLRPALRERYRSIRLFDTRPIADGARNEEVIAGDVTNLDQMVAACGGVGCLLHFAGIPNEAPWDRILSVNITGTYNAFEAARRQGVRRVVFASSNHVIGFHRSDREVGLDALPRPDSRYGVSKLFGEGIARLYADKHGLETVSLRLGSVRACPEDRRQLATWISYADTIALVVRAIEAADVHYATVYGVSANDRNLWSNRGAEALGFAPRDNAEAFAVSIPTGDVCADAVAQAFHGGPFCSDEFDGQIDRID